MPPERVVPHLLQLSDRRRRLIGLDASTRTRVEVDAASTPDVAIPRVVEEAQRIRASERV